MCFVYPCRPSYRLCQCKLCTLFSLNSVCIVFNLSRKLLPYPMCWIFATENWTLKCAVTYITYRLVQSQCNTFFPIRSEKIDVVSDWHREGFNNYIVIFIMSSSIGVLICIHVPAVSMKIKMTIGHISDSVWTVLCIAWINLLQVNTTCDVKLKGNDCQTVENILGFPV